MASVSHGSKTKKTSNYEHNLVVTGEVNHVVRYPDQKSYVEFHIDLCLEIRNNSSKTVIFYQDEPVGYWLALSEKDAQAGKYSLVSQGWESCEWSRKWLDLRRLLDKPLPPLGIVHVLNGGESAIHHKNQCTLLIPKKDHFNGSTNQLGWDIYCKHPTLWLKVDLLMWPVNIELPGSKDKPFGKKLRERWRAYGYLLLDFLESEPIELHLEQERDK